MMRYEPESRPKAGRLDRFDDDELVMLRDALDMLSPDDEDAEALRESLLTQMRVEIVRRGL